LLEWFTRNITVTLLAPLLLV